LQNTYAVLPQSGEAQLRVFNGFNCQVSVDFQDIHYRIEPLGFWKAPTLQADGEEMYHVNINGSLCSKSFDVDENVNVTETKVTCNKYMMRT